MTLVRSTLSYILSLFVDLCLKAWLISIILLNEFRYWSWVGIHDSQSNGLGRFSQSKSICLLSVLCHLHLTSLFGPDIISIFQLMQVKEFEQARNCLLPMGITSENVAHRFGVTRQEQDQAAVS